MDIRDDRRGVDLHLVLGNQLFPISNVDKINPAKIYMREDYGLCTFQKHHKQKITLFLSSMRSYKDYLNKHSYQVHYEYLNVDKSVRYIDSLKDFINKEKIKTMSIWTIEDKWFEKIIKKISEDLDELIILDSPMFLTSRDEFISMCPKTSKPTYKMTNFYINQRKKVNILMDNDKPIGGKWTFDSENRKKIGHKVLPPQIKKFKHIKHTLLPRHRRKMV